MPTDLRELIPGYAAYKVEPEHFYVPRAYWSARPPSHGTSVRPDMATSRGVEVRIAEPKDAADLAEVHADTWVATYVGNVPEDVASVRVARARDRDWTTHMSLRVQLGGGVLVLVDNDSVVGFCEFGPTEDEDDDASQVGHIMRIFIRPTHQGRGGGKLLMAAACDEMARRGFASATLWTPEDQWNHQAVDFYRDLGWTQEEVRAPGGDIRHRLVFE